MSMSDSSSLSSAQSTDDEAVAKAVNRSVGLQKYFKPKPKPAAEDASPPPPKRPASPPHEYVLADNPDIAFIVMFRSRFSEAFPKSLPHYGPQDIEKGVTDITPGDHIERLLCALIGLVLNRKKDVERGHYQRALEEAVQTHQSQWPRAWNGKSPLRGGGSFAVMSPDERLTFLKALMLWAMSSSEAIQAKIKESYKQARHEDDLNQPLSVQPWGRDAYKRQYWLIEGQDDTHFRLYRESAGSQTKRTWWSVAGTIDELKGFADSLDDQKQQAPKRLAEKIRNSIPRFEGSEEKRKRRDYRLARKAAFARPAPGFSLYEGRTRGKRINYAFSDDEDAESSDVAPTRKSARRSGISTPAEPSGPTFTASGRQIRSRVGGIYGETMTNDREWEETAVENGNGELVSNGRPQRSNRGRQVNGEQIDGYNPVDEMDEESEAASSGDEWNGGDVDANDDDNDDNDKISGDESEAEQPSLVVQLRYPKGKVPSSPIPPEENTPSADTKVSETKPTEHGESLTKPSDSVPADGEMEIDKAPEQPTPPPDMGTTIAINGVQEA